LKSLNKVRGVVDVSDPTQVKPNLDNHLGEELVVAIDAALEAQNGTVWKQSNGFAASMGNDCPRYLGYRLRGFDQEVAFNPQTYRIFATGHSLEDRIETYLGNLGIIVDRERKLLSKAPPLTGYVDFVIDWNGEKPVEVKSINDMGFKYRIKYNRPSDSHFRQLQVYLDIGGWDSGFVLYENKNDQSLKIFHVQKDQEFIDALYAKWKVIYDAHKENILSIRPHKQTTKKCKGCDAFTYCWADETEGEKLF
jgi:CRISPR/Cas system-associated exonuclease Cas4 (RecB family)